MDRLSEPSTWRGLVALATGLGIAITPEMAAAITAFGISLIGLVGMFSKDKK